MTEELQPESISGQDVFEYATAKEVPAEPKVEAKPEPEAPAEPEAKAERTRDDKGRFVSQQSEEPKPEPAEALPEGAETRPAAAKEDHRVPLSELLNTRERAQKAEAEREQLRQHLAQMQAQIRQMQAPKEEPIDMFAEPERWQQSYQQQMQQQVRRLEGDFSLRLAAMQHGQEALNKAYHWLSEQTRMGDMAAWQQVVNSRDPGETLVRLHKRDSVISQVGENPEEFVAKVLKEAMNDPEYVAQVVEHFKATAAPEAASPKTQVQLPPSLSKATGGTSDRSGSSDKDIWQYAIGRS